MLLSAQPCSRELTNLHRHHSECSPQPQHWGFQVAFTQQRKSIQLGPFTFQVLAARQRVPPDTDALEDWRNAQQTSIARLDPEQPQKACRAGHQGCHCHTPGSCGRPLPAALRMTTQKSPGVSQVAWNPAPHHRGDVWWWLPAPTPSGDNSQLCLSARNWPREQTCSQEGRAPG